MAYWMAVGWVSEWGNDFCERMSYEWMTMIDILLFFCRCIYEWNIFQRIISIFKELNWNSSLSIILNIEMEITEKEEKLV